MKVIRQLGNLKHNLRQPVVVTAGTFDGLHIAHKKIIQQAVSIARASRGTSVVITFDTPPRKRISPRAKTSLLVSLSHKLYLLEGLGADICVLLKFTKAFSLLSPEDFVRKILVGKLKARRIVVGYNYRFGKARKGNVGLLAELGKQYNFRVSVEGPVKLHGLEVSSTRIRELIESGDIDTAGKLLGRTVSIFGTVVKGRSLGRSMGYPTANINPHHEAIPSRGVYCVKAFLNGKNYTGILNIGSRPTFGSGGQSIEAHLLDFAGNLYGRDVQLYFVKKLRQEKKFRSKDALIEQLRLDEEEARRL